MVNDAGDIAILDIAIKGWGKKYVREKDRLIGSAVTERLNLLLVKTGLVSEAGGIEQNGQDILAAHERSWVNESKNPGLSRDEIEHSFFWPKVQKKWFCLLAWLVWILRIAR